VRAELVDPFSPELTVRSGAGGLAVYAGDR